MIIIMGRLSLKLSLNLWLNYHDGYVPDVAKQAELMCLTIESIKNTQPHNSKFDGRVIAASNTRSNCNFRS